MIDWSSVAKIAGGGYGLSILILIILALVAWIMGLVVQKTAKPSTESEESSSKE